GDELPHRAPELRIAGGTSDVLALVVEPRVDLLRAQLRDGPEALPELLAQRRLDRPVDEHAGDDDGRDRHEDEGDEQSRADAVRAEEPQEAVHGGRPSASPVQAEAKEKASGKTFVWTQ